MAAVWKSAADGESLFVAVPFRVRWIIMIAGNRRTESIF
jgi:hypothetical protein